MAASAADTIVNSMVGESADKDGDSRYISPELFTFRKALNSILMALSVLAAYPQVLGKDEISCMLHSVCADNATCSSRDDGHVITVMNSEQKSFADEGCKQTHMSPYRYYLMYILVAVSSASHIIQRLWTFIPSHKTLITKFLKLVEACDKSIGIERLMTKIHMPRKSDSLVSASQIEENVQVMEHLIQYDDDLNQDQKQQLINLVDEGMELKSGVDDAHSLGLTLTALAASLSHFILSAAYLIASNTLDVPVFDSEFICEHPSFDKGANLLICVDLQATFLTVIRFLHNFVLLLITVSRMYMEIRIQYMVHWRYKGNIQRILRYGIGDKKQEGTRHRNLLYLLVCLKLYDQKLFNAVSLIMSEQMGEVRRRQKIHQILRHLQPVVRAGKMGCVRNFVRQLRLLHIPDTEGRLQEVVEERGDVEVNLTQKQQAQFRACVDTVMTAADGQNMAALHRGVESGEPEVVDHLIISGADVDVRDVQQETPLHIAMRHGFSNIVEVLLRQKADFKARNKDGKTPIDVAIDAKQTWDLLCVAVRTGTDMDLINRLLDTGVDINTKRPDIGSLLHVAVHKNSSKIIHILLSHGAKLEIRDGGNRTPVQVAAVGASLKVVKMLVEAGADVHATTTDQGETVGVLQLAKHNERTAVREYLDKVLRGQPRSASGSTLSTPEERVRVGSISVNV